MYTILHLYCTKELVASTQEEVSTLGNNVQIISCHSIAEAQKALMTYSVNCIITDLHKNTAQTINLLQKWQETVDYCRNAIILIADKKNVVLSVLARIHFCEVYLNETPVKRNEMISDFLKLHYSLHQQLYNPSPVNIQERSINVKTNAGNKKCKLKDILYIEACKHKCIVHTRDDSFILPKPLCRFLECSQFSEFKQSHRSFFVNPVHIHQINTCTCPWVITFKNCNKQAFVSRSFKKLFDESIFY